MPEMRLERLEVGIIGTNCYLVQNQESKELLIIDPAGDAPLILKTVKEMEGTIKAILLTHGHFDHIGAVDSLAKTVFAEEEEELPVYILEEEARMPGNPMINGSDLVRIPITANVNRMLHEDEKLSLAGFDILVMHTPGHTSGSACFYFPEQSILFSGDTLFFRSVGRTDLPTGSMSELRRSLHEKLFSLPDEVSVFPGHGGMTTIGEEKRYNPF